MASPIKKKEIVCLTVLMASSLSTSAVFASGKTIAMASSGTLSDKSKSKSESSGQSKLDPMERRIVAQKHFEQGLKAKKTGDTSKALIELLKATREDPRYLEAYYQQAILFRDQSFHKLAASRLEQALAIDPDYQPARILLATIRLEQGNVTDAIEQLGKTLGIKPSSQIAEANQAPFDHNSKPERISVLQSLHPVLPGTILKQEEKSKIPVDTRDSGTSETHKRSISKHRKKSRTQKNTRQKIRQALAKKYRRFHGRKNKVHQRKPWIARIFKWPEPFRHGIIADDMTGAMDLLPKGSCQPEAVPKQPLEIAAELTAKADTLNEAEPKREALRQVSMTSLDLPFSVEEIKKNLVDSLWLNSAPGNSTKSSPEIQIEPVIESEPEKPVSKIIDDEWTRKLLFLKEHGTGTLKEGEAFMFAEDTGEAVLFLSDGKKIRRVITEPQTEAEIVKLRRPDIMVPKELLFDLSLLGKVVGDKNKKSPPDEQQQPPVSTTINEPQAAGPPSEKAPPSFRMEKMFKESNGFVDWLKGFVRM